MAEEVVNRRGGEEEEEEGEEKAVLQFVDSLDDYLKLFHSLSSTLRQGWLELASARHSMGSSRISSALFDLKAQSAPTIFQMTELVDGSPSVSQPQFSISKWASIGQRKCSSRDVEDEGLQIKYNTSQLRQRVLPYVPVEAQETNSRTKRSPVTADNNAHFWELLQKAGAVRVRDLVAQSSSSVGVQMERSKSLSVFGTLVSPKLRSAQASFETALETIVELANKRSLMLSAFHQLQHMNKSQTDFASVDDFLHDDFLYILQ